MAELLEPKMAENLEKLAIMFVSYKLYVCIFIKSAFAQYVVGQIEFVSYPGLYYPNDNDHALHDDRFRGTNLCKYDSHFHAWHDPQPEVLVA